MSEKFRLHKYPKISYNLHKLFNFNFQKFDCCFKTSKADYLKIRLLTPLINFNLLQQDKKGVDNYRSLIKLKPALRLSLKSPMVAV